MLALDDATGVDTHLACESGHPICENSRLKNADGFYLLITPIPAPKVGNGASASCYELETAKMLLPAKTFSSSALHKDPAPSVQTTVFFWLCSSSYVPYYLFFASYSSYIGSQKTMYKRS